ncbi:hypothetical protein MTR_2g070300 [Medicago truncatula]|uniref:Uncharacterized protein n=1 Tax=Medicago truncatula TaxID=3880 RepID=A0A072V8R9_MEDTR|nr:hypothetical protein MTR_2g070300 [Medicago truncatula]
MDSYKTTYTDEHKFKHPLSLPTVEEICGQDIWNNCAVRSVVSGVMGFSKTFQRRLMKLWRRLRSYCGDRV